MHKCDDDNDDDDDDDDDDDLFFFGMLDQRKALSPFSSRKHCQRSSSSQISSTLQDMVPRYGLLILLQNLITE